jgi:ribosomal protein L29
MRRLTKEEVTSLQDTDTTSLRIKLAALQQEKPKTLRKRKKQIARMELIASILQNRRT